MDRPENDVKAIFIAALDYEPGPGRAAYVESACADNADLRRRVEDLLAAHERADQVLGTGEPVTLGPITGHTAAEATRAEMPATDASSSPTSITAEHQGTSATDVLIAGRYTLQQRIGEGGMGDVWVAKQTEPVKRKVALKLIKTGMDSRAVLARFEQERQALAMMDHPNIAKVFDAGMTQNGQPFFVMELVNGLPLLKFCDEAKLTPKERLELFVPICQAVQHAHQKGIIHRDLKPANVLVTLIDGKPIPKVIDFGVAKAIGGKLTDQSLSTQFGAVVGTLEYMAPEQAAYSGVDVDTRADIYSLGVILYELLTGLRPIDAKRLKNAALTEMIRIIREEEPSKPSTRLSTEASLASLAALRQTEPRKLMALLRGELDWVVMKCLEKGRDRRYETAIGLAHDIERYLADEPVEARPPSAAYRLSKFLRRHKGPVAAALLVFFTLLAGIAGTTVGMIRAERQRAEAVRLRKLAQQKSLEAMAQRDIAEKARAQALAQKHIAEDQKQRALENARHAQESARTAELRLADSRIAQADRLSREWRFAEARQLYIEAYDKFAELKAPLLAAEIGLWSSYNEAGYPLLSLCGHKGKVRCVAISRDGRAAVSASEDRTLKLWDLPTGTLVRTVRGHSEKLTCVAITPDGKAALAGDAGGALKLWELSTGNALSTFERHADSVSCVAILPDGKAAISGSYDRTLKLWDLTTGKERHTFLGHSGPVRALAVAPDGRTAISGSEDSTLKVWDLSTGHELRTLNEDRRVVTSIAIAPDGRLVLSSGEDAQITGWDVSAGTAQWRAGGVVGSALTKLAFDVNGGMALIASSNKLFRQWRVEHGIRSGRMFAGYSDPASSIAVAPDGLTAIAGGNDNTLTLWDLAEDKPVRLFTGHSDWVKSVAISPDGRAALSGSADKTLRLWDLATARELRRFTVDIDWMRAIAITPDGKTALSGSADQTLKLWDLSTGKVLRTLTGHSDAVTSVAIAADGHTALSASHDKTLKLWDLSSGKELRTLAVESSTLSSLAIAPDKMTALAGCVDGTLKLWDLTTGKELRTLAGHSEKVSSVAISPDGRTAFSGSGDKTLKLWDLASGREMRTFSGHLGVVSSIAIAADGRSVLTGSYDRSLRLWDFSRGVAQRALEPRVALAQARLTQDPADPSALATLGQWYAFRGRDHWAVELLTRARDHGAAVDPLTLARCYWNLNRTGEAKREFQIATQQAKDSGKARYLATCALATEGDADRKRRWEATLMELFRDRARNVPARRESYPLIDR